MKFDDFTIGSFYKYHGLENMPHKPVQKCVFKSDHYVVLEICDSGIGYTLARGSSEVFDYYEVKAPPQKGKVWMTVCRYDSGHLGFFAGPTEEPFDYLDEGAEIIAQLCVPWTEGDGL